MISCQKPEAFVPEERQRQEQAVVAPFPQAGRPTVPATPILGKILLTGIYNLTKNVFQRAAVAGIVGLPACDKTGGAGFTAY